MDTGSNAHALRAADEAISQLTLFTGVLEDPIGQTYVELIDALTPLSALAARSEPGVHLGARETPPASPPSNRASVLYRRLFARLAGDAEFASTPLVGDAWQNHLLNRLLRDENPFSAKAQQSGLSGMSRALRDAAAHDLDALHRIFQFAGNELQEAVTRREPECGPLPGLGGFEPSDAPSESNGDADGAVKRSFLAANEWKSLLEPLAAYIHERGLGIFRDFRAFRWDRRDGNARLAGIAEPDPVRLDDLIGYDAERELLLQNTEHFVAGFPANNVLLYGDRGTGKSSTVKALLGAYADRGLRMVEVHKENLGDFPSIIGLLRGRRERFVLFIDDLSFEEHETHYKDLKALLEGSLEARPDNIVLYATSNRRHLIKERHSDRIHQLEDDEIHLNDTTEEKLSLSDRFGLTLTFQSPTQTRYLEIVRGIAARSGVSVPDEILTTRALAWATQRGGRSGRVARQFLDHLRAELQMKDRG